MSDLMKREPGTREKVAYVKGLGTGAAAGIGGAVLVGMVGFLPAALIAGGGYVAWKLFRRK